jgi:3',5'-cyclic AMP phosphodiesterase CpdA
MTSHGDRPGGGLRLVALILHLSDLHLSQAEFDEPLGDYKLNVIPAPDRVRRTTMIRSSLRSLGQMLLDRGDRLDALVVSGDVTYRASEDGFALLADTLGELGGALPAPEQILVVPGNHDVRWFTPPSSHERYSTFVTGVRSLGYRTPLLEGIDILPDGELVPTATNPVVLTEDKTVAILALNTTNHCGIEQVTSPEVQAAIDALTEGLLDDRNLAILRQDWQSRGRFDIARLDPLQRRWASELLRRAVAQLPRPPLRLAVIHHQLLPVNTDEEIKPFESLTNLGEVREFFAANDIDLLLHGHKHASGIYEDRYVTSSQAGARGRILLVCSTATVGMGQTSQGEIAKVIDVRADLPTIRRVIITSIPARGEGIPLRAEELAAAKEHVLGRGDVASGVFAGRTGEAVYEQLIDVLSNSREQVPRPVLCRIDDSQSARFMPSTYPPVSGYENRLQEWFNTMVDWWQRRRAGRGMEFNHGERLRDYRGDIDQIEQVVHALRSRSDSSRGVVALLDPKNDQIGNPDARFPAFVLAQFLVADGAVHAIAYFRKQEMIYWWPINVAEIARLQAEVIAGLEVHGQHLAAGSIITVTALPIVGYSVPRVSVPLVDRIADDAHGEMLRNVVALVASNVPNRADTFTWWQEIFDDWRPTEKPAPDGDPAPSYGLEVLAELINEVAAAHKVDTELEQIVELLRHLASENKAYLLGERRARSGTDRGRWAKDARERIDRLLGATAERLGAEWDQAIVP